MSTPTMLPGGGQPATGAARTILFSELLSTEPPALGPYVLARCTGHCVDCGRGYILDEWIRADGHGAWFAECCGGEA